MECAITVSFGGGGRESAIAIAEVYQSLPRHVHQIFQSDISRCTEVHEKSTINEVVNNLAIRPCQGRVVDAARQSFEMH